MAESTPRRQFDNELKGCLFQNKQRGDDKKKPVAKGFVQVAGKKYWLAAFPREIKKGPNKGDKMWSLTLTPADQEGDDVRPQQREDGAPVSAARPASGRRSSERRESSR